MRVAMQSNDEECPVYEFDIDEDAYKIAVKEFTAGTDPVHIGNSVFRHAYILGFTSEKDTYAVEAQLLPDRYAVNYVVTTEGSWFRRRQISIVRVVDKRTGRIVSLPEVKELLDAQSVNSEKV